MAWRISPSVNEVLFDVLSRPREVTASGAIGVRDDMLGTKVEKKDGFCGLEPLFEVPPRDAFADGLVGWGWAVVDPDNLKTRCAVEPQRGVLEIRR